MQNKKGNVAVIAIIIVIVAITAGVVGWMFAKNSQAPDQKQLSTQSTTPIQQVQPVTPPVAKTTPTPVQSQTMSQGAIYTNELLGYQVTLPKGWENYKATGVDGGIEISLPTSDPDYKVGVDPDTGKKQAPLVEIFAWTNEAWNTMIAKCKKNPDPSCFGDDLIASKSNKYVFVVAPAQTPPPQDSGLIDADGNVKDFITPIKQSFKIIK